MIPSISPSSRLTARRAGSLRPASRLAATAAAAVLLVAACGGSDDDADADATVAAPPTTEVSSDTTMETPETTEAADTVPETTEATEATDTTDAPDVTATPATVPTDDVPTDAEPTAPGTQLAFGDAAVVALDEQTPDELIELTVQPLGVGTADELAQLQVDDLAGGETLHYVTLDITNISSDPTGDLVPNWSFQLLVMQDNGEVAVPVINFVDFEPCDEEDPDEVQPGESFTTCLTYLSEAGATPTSVLFAQSMSADPITWK
jgi:hypothetical protein